MRCVPVPAEDVLEDERSVGGIRVGGRLGPVVIDVVVAYDKRGFIHRKTCWDAHDIPFDLQRGDVGVGDDRAEVRDPEFAAGIRVHPVALARCQAFHGFIPLCDSVPVVDKGQDIPIGDSF